MGNGVEIGIDIGQCVQSEDTHWLWNGLEISANNASPTLILAHGAGAPMDSPFMTAMANALALCGISVVRFEFPYMAARRLDGRKRPPNPQAQLLDCWRAVHAGVRQHAKGPLAIGGKSMGGRMAGLLADELEADALICLGYPFHPAGRSDKPRVGHLAQLKTPTLIIQGERDALGNHSTVSGYDLSPVIKVHWLAAADHDLRPLKAAGISHSQYLENSAQVIADFLFSCIQHP